MKPSELLLHPVRLRVAQSLLGDRSLTTTELRQELPDVAPATLYRQVATLVEGGVLEVVDERRVRGTFERTYRLRGDGGSIDADQAATMTQEEHRQGFLAFIAALLADYDRYLDTGDVDLGRDLVGYRQAALHLSDAELVELLADLRGVLAPRLALTPAPGRRRRALTTILMPADRQPIPSEEPPVCAP